MEQFLELFISFLCAKCGTVFYPHKELYFHNMGRINRLLTPRQKIPDKYFENYFNDVEHGFFHGICSCYIAYLLKDGDVDEQEMASILLHDFLKCNGFTQDSHDTDLFLYYDKLMSETYTHSNPLDQGNILVKSDRIELTRYDDYKEWVDNRYYDICKTENKHIDEFYNNIRPSLLYFYKNRNSVFLCSYDNTVEVDRVPFGYENFDVIEQHGFCSNHGLGFSHNIIKKFISINDFSGIVDVSDFRSEKLIITSESNSDKWYFLYQGINETHKHIEELKSNNENIISQQLVKKFFTLVRMLQDRLIVMNHAL